MSQGACDLQTIPGVGPRIADLLHSVGIHQVSDLRGASAQALYDELGRTRGQAMDRCVLYVFRCAVYYASTKKPQPRLLQWWNWKGEASPKPARRRAAAR